MLSPEVLEALERHSYPGNMRDLRNIIEHAVVHGTTAEVMLEDMPPYLRGNNGKGHKKSLEELEREHIVDVLGHTGGKKTKAAAILGISRKTLNSTGSAS